MFKFIFNFRKRLSRSVSDHSLLGEEAMPFVANSKGGKFHVQKQKRSGKWHTFTHPHK